jgi:TRAP-type transport system small permease protein
MSKQNETAASPDTSLKGLDLFIYRFDKALKPLVLFATIIGCAALALMMILTFFNVSGRVLFDLPVKGYFEMIELSMLLMTVFAVVYTGSKKGHIRVDIVTSYLPKKVARVFDIAMYSVAFVFFVFVTWRGFVNGLDNLGDNLTTGVLHFPIYPFNFILSIGTGLLALVFLRDFLKSISEETK